MISKLFLLYFLCNTATCSYSTNLENDLFSLSSNDELVDKILSNEQQLQDLFPLLTSTCVKEALFDFLPECLDNGFETVSLDIRVETAVKLSLCQFEVSGLGHIPEPCQNKNSNDSIEAMMECMLQLETSVEWWTTYNGYYQKLPQICLENSLPYQKEQVLRMFLNITEWYSEINSNWDNQFHEHMDMIQMKSFEKMENFLMQMNKYVVQLNETTGENFDSVRYSFESFFKKLSELMEKRSDAFLREYVSKDKEIQEEIGNLKDLISTIKDEIINDKITEKIEEFHDTNLNRWEEFNEQTELMLQIKINEQNMISHEVDNYLRNIRNKFEIANDDANNMQMELYQDIYKNVSLDIVDLKNDFLNEWFSLTTILNKDIKAWNDVISDKFKNISTELDLTINKIEYIESKINILLNLVNIIQANLRFLYRKCKMFSKLILLKKKFWIGALFLMVFRGKIHLNCCHNYSIIINWILIIGSIYSGNLIGSCIINYIF